MAVQDRMLWNILFEFGEHVVEWPERLRWLLVISYKRQMVVEPIG